MTCKEKFALDQPHIADQYYRYCPQSFGYLPPQPCPADCDGKCEECWDREVIDPENVKDVDECMSKIKEIKNSKAEGDDEAWEAYKEYVLDPLREQMNSPEPHILDSGDRTEFATGAVRDMREGKGRCDLLPLDVVASFLATKPGELDDVLMHVYSFQKHKDERLLYTALSAFAIKRGWDDHTMLLEVAKHFEEGCKKYGENNWRKGIPVHCYIDSAIRHYLKWLRGDKDEPHDRAFCWNILCCIWTVEHIGGKNSDCGGEKEDSR